MSDDRVIELEIKLSYLEKSFGELSDVDREVRGTIDRLTLAPAAGRIDASGRPCPPSSAAATRIAVRPIATGRCARPAGFRSTPNIHR